MRYCKTIKKQTPFLMGFVWGLSKNMVPNKIPQLSPSSLLKLQFSAFSLFLD